VCIAITPLIIDNTHSLEIFQNQYFYFNICIETLAIGGIYFFIKKTGIIRLTALDYALGILFIYLLIHSFCYSISKERISILLNLWTTYFLAKITTSYLLKRYGFKKTTKIILIPFLYVVGAEICICFLQNFSILPSLSPYYLITGTFSNSSKLCTYLTIITPIIFILLSSRIFNKKRNLLLGFLFVTSILIIIILKNRTSIIASLCSIVFILYKLKHISLKYLFIGIVLIFCLFIFLFFYKYDSAVGRIFIWKVCCIFLWKNMILGKGIGNFSAIYNKAQCEYFTYMEVNMQEVINADFVNYPYNEILSILIEIGIIGLLIIVFCIRNIIRKQQYYNIVRQNSSILYAIWGTFISVFILSMFAYPFRILSVITLLFMAVGLLSSLQHPIVKINISKQVLLSIFGIVLYMSFLFVHIITLYHFKLIRKADFLTHDKYPTVMSIYNKNIKFCQNDPVILYKYSSYLFDNQKYEEAEVYLKKTIKFFPFPAIYNLMGDTYMKLQKYDMAEKEYINGIYTIPHKFVSRYKLFLLYQYRNQDKLAQKIAMQILNLPIKIKSEKVHIIKKEAKEFLENKIKKNIEE